MKRLVTAALVVIGGFASAVRADDKTGPTGTWKWSVEINGQSRDFTLKLKMDGDKLTGVMVRNDMETKIADAKFKDGEVSFSVTRERNGNTFTSKYTGKITGDTFKGKSETEFNGETRTTEFEAKRSKD